MKISSLSHARHKSYKSKQIDDDSEDGDTKMCWIGRAGSILLILGLISVVNFILLHLWLISYEHSCDSNTPSFRKVDHVNMSTFGRELLVVNTFN